ncbi:MAG: SIS domain-containing protein [Clostridia bacterium]|nr:SIS domain-containing protein [Clostridia bacterium]
MLNDLLKRYPALCVCADDIESSKNAIIECFKNGGKLLLCGNGGSCADCDHIAGELMKGYLKKRPVSPDKKAEMKNRCNCLDDSVLDNLQCGLPAVSLPSFTALNTAFCNDVDAQLVYAQAVFAMADKNDILIALSTSGNSKNVVDAVKVAKGLGVKVIALTGDIGGKLKTLSDISICVPETETYKIQELHLPVYHYICAEVEDYFFER